MENWIVDRSTLVTTAKHYKATVRQLYYLTCGFCIGRYLVTCYTETARATRVPGLRCGPCSVTQLSPLQLLIRAQVILLIGRQYSVTRTKTSYFSHRKCLVGGSPLPKGVYSLECVGGISWSMTVTACSTAEYCRPWQENTLTPCMVTE